MDRRDAMTFSGSTPYYMQRGVTASGSGLQGSPTIYPLTGASASFQPNTGGSSIGSTLPVDPSSTMSGRGVSVGAPSAVPQGEPVRRKRGRPRKYGPDGKVSLALNPTSSTPPPTTTPTQKRGRGRPPGSGRKQQLASIGGWLSNSAGFGFTPHVITISVGEDITTKIMSFSQQGPRAICILSANGAISTVTLRQPSSSGGTVTYEGRFEILCLSGSYLLSANSGSHSRTGGLSVSLASPDGRVVGGGVGGVLIAASPVQVIVGSFVCGSSKTKEKDGQSLGSAGDLDQQTVDNSVTITSFPPSQNLTSTSSMGTWPGSVQMAHGDIDLMHG
ncbi:AT-hook motif nuclear-localized protein 9-like [Coffea eugenioides]|uniref:AT-hook motif nuclear-localized protein n=1 Tax=Coffea arabica TaxID=13443 RepID=A0A6P6WIX7_COFAR|nr:AT-hook motif nuclear-localized protein 9-like [Coffea arabica]XP_027115161.1 AT-hook motif nuclear-localized protein 9-like [Coffea arabica]XP_027158724.1 AT-hook motif nuclear-localized protein 9-like [Coffea eugenioides]XP_027158725.1 AT-hook motif nuclear-localized protein 9-like [Coffea eugenioides]